MQDMAFFHMHGSHGSRQGGQSALAKLMYVLRRGKYALGRDDLEAFEWGHLPEWCDGDPAPLFAGADLYERANARLFVELEGALPHQLDLEQCIELVRAMVDAVAATGLPYAWAIHAGRPVAPGEPRNRHWHLVLLERINDGIRRVPERWFRRANPANPAAGGAAKDRSLKGHEWLPKVRRRYEQLINAALERAGRTERVTAASHHDRIARAEAIGDHETAERLRRHPPGLHIGPTASAIERGRPGRNEQPTIRGGLARARNAEAARLRAELESVDRELTDHHRAAVAAAQDADVDGAVVAAAQPGNPETVIALVEATEIRRHEIREAARRQGFDDDLIAEIRATAGPDSPDLGWTAVAESTGEYVGHVERARDIGLSVDIDALMAGARRRRANPAPHLARLNDVWAKAQGAGFDNARLHDIYTGAEERRAGTGSTAIEEATAEHGQRKSAAEAAARIAFVDVDAVCRRAREGNEDKLDALEEETAKAQPAVAAAREAGLDEAAIGRILRVAESKEYGSGWAALTRATAKRVERKSAAEAAAGRLGLHVEVIYAKVGDDADPVDQLERVTAVWGQARRAGLDNGQLNDIYRGAEHRQTGSGWTAIEDAAVERVERKSAAAAAAARSAFVDVDAVCRRAREGNEDELDALEGETAKAEPVVAAAREAGLDEAAIGRILREADLTEEYGSGWAALAQATQRWARARELRAKEEERKRGEWADLAAEVRGTSAGAERLEEARRARVEATKRSLTLDEELVVVKEERAGIEADIASRKATVEASRYGRDLLRRVERRRGGPPQSLPEREETIEGVELRVQAADEAEKGLMVLARDPERPDRRVPFVTDALLDAVAADGDEAFLDDVVWLLHARFAHAERKGGDRGGYDAEDRERLLRHHFGSALTSAFAWCALKIRALILAACHTVLGGRGEMGARVQASLEMADAARQSYQRTVHEEALTVDINPNAFSEEAREDGRDEVAAIREETERRRQVISDATANDINVDAFVRAAKVSEAGAWFPAVEAVLERFRTAAAAAPWLHLDVKAFCASARSKGEDPLQALEEETAWRTRVRLLADFVDLSFRDFRHIHRAAEGQRRDSGYTAVAKECIRRQTRELVRHELPFGYSQPALRGTWALAVPDEVVTDLLREVQDDGFLHSRLSEVLASSPGSAEERQGAERRYHRTEVSTELQRLKAERGWLSSTPTEEDALKAVRARFIPALAEQLRAACDGVADLDRLVARLVEDDWVRRVVTELPRDLPRELLEPGSGWDSTAASDERLSRIAAAMDDPRARKVVVAYQARESYTAQHRQRAEASLLERRRREGEEAGQQAQDEGAASRAYDAELLRILQDICRRVQFRQFEEVCHERVRDRTAKHTGPGLGDNRGAHERDSRRDPQGWSP